MTTPLTPSSAEKARIEAARREADAGLALARFEALARQRDAHRRAVSLQPLWADPTAVAPAGWSEHTAPEFVASGAAAQPLTPEDAAAECSRLLWVALAKIVGAVLALCFAIGLAAAMAAGMEG